MCLATTTMDSFLKTLLVERSKSCPSDLNTSSHKESFCVVVDDNARCHNQRWSRLSRRVRGQMNPRSQSEHKKKTRSKSGNPNQASRTANHNDSDGSINSNNSSSRWVSMEGGASIPSRSSNNGKRPASAPSNGSKQPKDIACAIPAPPSCPQRQQSIEVNQHQLQQHMARERIDANTDCETSLPRAPQRKQSIEISSGGGHKKPAALTGVGSFTSLTNTKNLFNNNSKLIPVIHEEQLDTPRMPQRKASVFDNTIPMDGRNDIGINAPIPPPMSSLGSSSSPPLSNHEGGGVLLAGQSFTKVIKRTRASLLDDDDDEEFEMDNTPHPFGMPAF